MKKQTNKELLELKLKVANFKIEALTLLHEMHKTKDKDYKQVLFYKLTDLAIKL